MTELIASIAGPYLFVTGLGFFISSGFYQRMIAAQSDANPILLNLSGAVHFVVGMVVLANHFTVSSVAGALVTLVGAAAALKGASLIVIPDYMTKSQQMGKTGVLATGAAFTATGAYLSYVGYF
ncbi:hypothetical protein [Pseudovibrio brasiliensis]|uniref:Uncharacterized protein n=1 Tax=Pseudovibrio brasiliensis TaxID=1898042 RepID=A0ABX8AHN3_9HYPH|nr:hypothetical protein [Pseudovibrio brasiliensis]QUS54529.1 hypothetical protein KGB56_14125 [Pseudovibrio brasiliensis]